MPITKATASSIAAKGDLVVGSATNDASVLAVGSANQVLTVDSSTATGLKWAAPSSGSLTLLSTTTLSGSSTDITGISGAYTDLEVHIYGVTNNTANGNITFRPNSTAGPAMVGLYNTAIGGGTVVTFGKDSNGAQNLNGPTNDRTSVDNYWVIYISNYANTTNFKPIKFFGTHFGTAPSYVGIGAWGGIPTNSAITSILFASSGGTFSAGTVKVYGVK
jgi:hypothetical protein